MSNLFIVEAENDAIFIKAVVNDLNEHQGDLLIDINSEIEYQTLGGKDALTQRLKDIKATLEEDPIPKIGIILDQDNDSKEDKIKFVNDCIKAIFPDAEEITDTHQLTTLTTINEEIIFIACYFINVDGQGELETLLRRIKNHDSSIADCLESCLIQCLENYPKEINRKNLDKTWVVNYLRYDTCDKKDKGNRDKRCSFNAEGFQYVMKNKADIWNFEDPALDELKQFLELF